MRSLATIGYEGTSTDAFDETLQCANVDLVVDVRAVAVSRRRGFSKNALAARLREQGIQYLHLRDLGDPKAGRMAARAGDLQTFRSIYSDHLATSAAQIELSTLCGLAANWRVALLCFEADPAGCHRAIVAQLVAKKENLSIHHLKVEPGSAAGGGARTSDHSRQSVAPA